MSELDLDVVARYAALAPSVHNTQPWRFGTAADAIEVRADRTKQLTFLDPTARQLFVSCGAATEFAYLAVRDEARACTVEILPEPNDPDLVARVRVGPSQPVTPLESSLAEAIARRYTDRGPYDDRPVPPEVSDDISGRCAELN